MKTPFEKQINSSVIAAVVLGSVAIGVAAYLFLTEKGAHTRDTIKRKIKEKAKKKAAKIVSKKTGLPKKAVKAVADHIVN